jgi:hypothetical protein
LFENVSKRSKGNLSKQLDPLKDKDVAIDWNDTTGLKELVITAIAKNGCRERKNRKKTQKSSAY